MTNAFYWPYHNTIVHDFYYYIHEYLGLGTGIDFSAPRAVSSGILSIDPTSRLKTPPVAMGGIAELKFNWGSAAAICLMFVLGLALGYAEAQRPRSVVRRSLLAIVVLSGYDFITHGDLAYYVLNWAMVSVMIALIGIAAWFIPTPSERPAMVNRSDKVRLAKSLR